MLVMSRREFLNEFLGALGAKEIKWKVECEEYISGTVIYDLNDPEEVQDFIWHKSEQEVPRNEVCKLAKLINAQNLLSIDQISVTRLELKKKYNIAHGVIIYEQDFISILEELKSIEVRMVDGGEETDVYFIHE